MAKAVAAIFLFFCAVFLKSAFAAEISETTACSTAVSGFNAEDMATAKAFGEAVLRVMGALDAGERAQGNPALLPKWDNEARADNLALVMVDCRMNPDWTIQRAAADVYEGLRGKAK